MKKSAVVLLLLSCCLVLLGYNFALQRKVAVLWKENRYLVSTEAPVVDSFVRRIDGLDLSNQETSIDFTSRSKPTLLLVFSPACRFCAENWPNWHKLLQSAADANVVFADTSGLADLGYFQKVGISPPIQLVKIGLQTKLASKLNATPTTILLAPGGRVKGAWVGLLSDDDLKTARRELSKN